MWPSLHWPFCNIIFLKIHIIRVQEEDSLLKNNVQILVFLLVMLKISNLHFLISHQKSAFHLLTLKSPFPRLLQLHTLLLQIPPERCTLDSQSFYSCREALVIQNVTRWVPWLDRKWDFSLYPVTRVGPMHQIVLSFYWKSNWSADI